MGMDGECSLDRAEGRDETMVPDAGSTRVCVGEPCGARAGRRLPSRIILGGFAAALLAGCHHAAPSAAIEPRAEEVNIGYGSLPRAAVTGAVESATAGKMSDRSVGRVEEMLEGRFSGLDVVRLSNGDFSLRIRGSTREPLVVINGIPSPLGLRNPLHDLAPGSIARVDVLKDAGSTAAYGFRGANGVILVTTKRAR